jgi:hypothetical protein
MLLAAIATLALTSLGPEPKPLRIQEPIRDKNFYFLRLLHQDASLEALLAQDVKLANLAANSLASLKAGLDHTGPSDVSGLGALALTNDQVEQVADELHSALTSRFDLRRSLVASLRASGAYQRYADRSDDDLIRSAWLDCAKGLNGALAVYGTQTKPAPSPSIDSPLYTTKNEGFGMMVHTAIAAVLDEPTKLKLFFDPILELDSHLLDIQLRNEAGRFEPMESGINKDAFRAIGKTKFANFPYTVILVPGEGPEESNVQLSPMGKLRLELAVHRFRAKKAPFILVSGGYVHPNMTPYSEAIEMRRSLVQDFGVPSSAIIVDPHARHTTTNMRNAARLMFRYGIPFDRKALVVSDPYQVGYIESKSFFDRCQRVFGYQPADGYVEKSPYELEFKPALNSLSIDPSDALDP